jgi:hypothetical protein
VGVEGGECDGRRIGKRSATLTNVDFC